MSKQLDDKQLSDIESAMGDDERVAIANLRGGCSCSVSPPCSACCSPLTQDEADELGLIPEEIDAMTATPQDAPTDAPAALTASQHLDAIRAALALGPTPNDWTYGVRTDGSIWLSVGDHKTSGPHYQADLCASPADAALIVACRPDAMREVLKLHDLAMTHAARTSLEAFAGNIEAVNALDLDTMDVQPILQAVQYGEISTGRARELLRCWVLGTFTVDMLPKPEGAFDVFNDDDEPPVVVRKLRAELAKAERSAIAFGDVISNHCIAMQAAVIEFRIGRGAGAGMVWIENTLRGPGLLPDLESASRLGSAQAWFDTETAKEAARVAALKAETKGATHG